MLNDIKNLIDNIQDDELCSAKTQYSMGLSSFFSFINTSTLPERFKWVELLNILNVPEANLYLGALYQPGDDTEKYLKQAIKLLKASAKQNYAQAQYFLGFYYQHVNIRTIDDEKVEQIKNLIAALKLKIQRKQNTPSDTLTADEIYKNFIETDNDINTLKDLEIKLINFNSFKHGFYENLNLDKAFMWYQKAAACHSHDNAIRLMKTISFKKPKQLLRAIETNNFIYLPHYDATIAEEKDNRKHFIENLTSLIACNFQITELSLQGNFTEEEQSLINELLNFNKIIVAMYDKHKKSQNDDELFLLTYKVIVSILSDRFTKENNAFLHFVDNIYNVNIINELDKRFWLKVANDIINTVVFPFSLLSELEQKAATSTCGNRFLNRYEILLEHICNNYSETLAHIVTHQEWHGSMKKICDELIHKNIDNSLNIRIPIIVKLTRLLQCPKENKSLDTNINHCLSALNHFTKKYLDQTYFDIPPTNRQHQSTNFFYHHIKEPDYANGVEELIIHHKAIFSYIIARANKDETKIPLAEKVQAYFSIIIEWNKDFNVFVEDKLLACMNFLAPTNQIKNQDLEDKIESSMQTLENFINLIAASNKFNEFKSDKNSVLAK